MDLPTHVGRAQRHRRRHRRLVAAGPDAGVVVDAQEVQRRLDQRHVAVLDLRVVGDAGVLRIAPLEQRIHVPAHEARVLGGGSSLVGCARGRRGHAGLVQHDAQRAGGAAGPHRAHCQAVRQQQVVRDLRGQLRIALAWRELADLMAQHRGAPGLVVGRQRGQPVAQPPRDRVGINSEVESGVAIAPAAAILQSLRQVPVIQRRVRRDAALEQSIDEAVVEVQAALVEEPLPQRLHARPGDGEAVGIDAQARDHRDVVLPAAVVVAGDGAALAIDGAAGLAREGVPDRRAAAVDIDGALDLVGAGRDAPGEGVAQLTQRGGGEAVGSGEAVGHGRGRAHEGWKAGGLESGRNGMRR